MNTADVIAWLPVACAAVLLICLATGVLRSPIPRDRHNVVRLSKRSPSEQKGVVADPRYNPKQFRRSR